MSLAVDMHPKSQTLSEVHICNMITLNITTVKYNFLK